VSNEYSARQRQQPTPRIGAGKENTVTVDTLETLSTSTAKNQSKVSKKALRAPSYKDFKKNLSEDDEVARAIKQPAPKKRSTTCTVQLKVSKLKKVGVINAKTAVPTSKDATSKQKKREQTVMLMEPAAKVTKKIAKAAQSNNKKCAHDIYQLDKTYYDITIAQELDYALKGSSECALCYKEFGRDSNQIKPSKTRPLYACIKMRHAACNHAVCFQCFSGEIIKMDGLSRKRKTTIRFEN